VLVKKLAPGDKLFLDGKYDLTGGPYEFPDDFTLEAVQHGGFTITDGDNARETFRLGNRNVMRNVTLSHPNTPKDRTKSTNAKPGIHHSKKIAIVVEDKEDCTFEYCRFEGFISTHLKLNGRRHTIRHCHIVGGYWATYWAPPALDYRVQYTFFQDATGEALKTGRAPDAGTQRPIVEHCVFQGAWRDGIDTTGGFKDGIIRDCIFRRNDVGGVGGGIDLKTAMVPGLNWGQNLANRNVRIERCQFIDLKNAIVLTFNDRDRTMTPATAPRFCPQEIYVNDCIFEKTAEWTIPMRAFLIKGAHTVSWKNLERRGDVILQETTGAMVSDEVRAAVNYNLTGTELPQAAPRPYDEDVPFVHGPQPKVLKITGLSGHDMRQVRR
jgi:hypothetical protein